MNLFTFFVSAQETPLISNPHEGIIVSNQSLVLQNVNRRQSGIYTCVAHNIEGDGVSNPMTLNIRCKHTNFASFFFRRRCSTIFNLQTRHIVNRVKCKFLALPVTKQPALLAKSLPTHKILCSLSGDSIRAAKRSTCRTTVSDRPTADRLSNTCQERNSIMDLCSAGLPMT